MTRGSRCTSSQSASSATGWAVTSAIVGSVSFSTSISRARGERKATSGFSGVTTPPLSSFPVATTSSRIESAGARGEVDKSLETDRNGVRATRTVERRNAGLATPRNRGMFPPEIPLTPPEMPVTAEPMLLAMLLTGGGGALPVGRIALVGGAVTIVLSEEAPNKLLTGWEVAGAAATAAGGPAAPGGFVGAAVASAPWPTGLNSECFP